MKKRKNKDDPSGWRSSWGRIFGGVSSVSHFPSYCFHCVYLLLEPRVAHGPFLAVFYLCCFGPRFDAYPITYQGPLGLELPWVIGCVSMSSALCTYLSGLWLYGLLLLTPSLTSRYHEYCFCAVLDIAVQSRGDRTYLSTMFTGLSSRGSVVLATP